MITSDIITGEIYQSRFVQNLYAIVYEEPAKVKTSFEKIGLDVVYTKALKITRVGILNSTVSYDNRPMSIGEDYFRSGYVLVEDPDTIKMIKMIML